MSGGGAGGYEGRESGFATIGATMACLALSLAVAVAVTASTVELRGAEQHHSRMVAEYALDAAHQQAALDVERAGRATRLGWTVESAGRTFRALAEAEAAKLAPSQAAKIEPPVFVALGVRDPSALRIRLSALTMEAALGSALEAADPSPTWRTCARSLVSPWGTARRIPPLMTSAPSQTGRSPRLGEVWRIRVSRDGWTDDRVVRFTADPLSPAGVIERRIYRAEAGPDRCVELHKGD